MKTLLIDNYDSYTFNLYQSIAKVNGEEPFVIRNDQLDWTEFRQLDYDLGFDNVVISPGPGHPACKRDFGICTEVLQQFEKPILGVCLGHQGIGYAFGGSVVHGTEVKHGCISQIYHQGVGLFQKIPSPFMAVRYHSLIVSNSNLPECLEIIAETEDGLIMGLCHRHNPIFGVQFHPESICTDYGEQLLANFKNITSEYRSNRQAVKVSNSNITPKLPLVHPIGFPKLGASKKINSSSDSGFRVFFKKLVVAPDPEQVFVHLYGNSPYAFWLDSSQVELGLSRFSFMGNNDGCHGMLLQYYTQNHTLQVTQNSNISYQKTSIFDYLQIELDRRFSADQDLPFNFNCGFVGYFGYELKIECGAAFAYPFDLPSAAFLLATQMIAFDHEEKTTYLLYFGKPQELDQANFWFQKITDRLDNLPTLPETQPLVSQAPILFHLKRSRQTYLQDIAQCLEEIRNGQSYEICLTNRIYTHTSVDPLSFYCNLRHSNPAPYAAFLRFGDFAIVSSSPEQFLKVDRDRWVETKPIKGTLPRGKTLLEDTQIKEQLANSEKTRSENLMVVDLLRNDLGLICEIGSIQVPKLMEVKTYATVHQLVSTIRGRLRTNVKITDCIRSVFPGGSMTGAPKLRTMEIIDRLEGEARGIYSGAIGFLGLNGTADLNIAIRTAIVTSKGVSIGVGGGIIALSDPEQEFAEILLKAKALIHAIVETAYGKVDPELTTHELFF